jgi:signal peptidase I
MARRKTEKTDSGRTAKKKKDRAAEIANTFEWLITAFILAFVFRAFVMEAFRIPTGSMADTLKGAHFRLRCPQCGYRYDHGFSPVDYGLGEDTVPSGRVAPPRTRCPSCGYYWPNRFSTLAGETPVADGDRILVLKCIYQFFEPKRWDVVVFKNPLEPHINYIKRLIGLPEEKLEIIDGDVYVNDEIAHKPPKVQKQLWMPVYNNDYQPARPNQGVFNGHLWQQPFKNGPGSQWVTTDPNAPTLFRLKSPTDQIHTLVYDSSLGNDFRAAHAYDEPSDYGSMPYCSDLMLRFCLRPSGSRARIGIGLSKYETHYRAWLDLSGQMTITKISQDTEEVLDSRSVEPPSTERFTLVEFANVDHRLIFRFGSEELPYDLGGDPNDAGSRQRNIPPEARIFGAGDLTLAHVAIFRDIHYTAKKFANSPEEGRAIAPDPFVLGKDQYFMLGDNSPRSEDSRWWEQRGRGNNDKTYRKGIVPRDYLVGKALFVYWPMGYRLFAWDPFGIVPNVGQLRFVCGGSSRNE